MGETETRPDGLRQHFYSRPS